MSPRIHLPPDKQKPLLAMAFWLVLLFGFCWLLSALSSILLPFVAGVLLAYLLDPVVDRLEKRRINRNLGTALVLGASVLVFVLVLVLVLPLAVEQLAHFLKSLPAITEKLHQLLDDAAASVMATIQLNGYAGVEQDITTALSSQSNKLVGVLTAMVDNLWQSGLALLNLLSLLLITPLVAFYFLRDWDVMKNHLESLLPRRHAATVVALVGESDAVLSGFIRGQVNVCLLLAAYYAVALSIAGLPYGLLIGLAGGLLAFIPYVGTAIGMASGLAVAWFHAGEWSYMAIILAIFVVAQFVEGNFLTPKLVGSRVGLHPVWVIFGMLAGGALMGVAGVLIAVPLTAVVGVLVRFALAQYRESPLYKAL